MDTRALVESVVDRPLGTSLEYALEMKTDPRETSDHLMHLSENGVLRKYPIFQRGHRTNVYGPKNEGETIAVPLILCEPMASRLNGYSAASYVAKMARKMERPEIVQLVGKSAEEIASSPVETTREMKINEYEWLRRLDNELDLNINESFNAIVDASVHFINGKGRNISEIFGNRAKDFSNGDVPRELKFKVPTHYQRKLYSLKAVTGKNLSDIMTEVIGEYFADLEKTVIDPKKLMSAGNKEEERIERKKDKAKRTREKRTRQNGSKP